MITIFSKKSNFENDNKNIKNIIYNFYLKKNLLSLKDNIVFFLNFNKIIINENFFFIYLEKNKKLHHNNIINDDNENYLFNDDNKNIKKNCYFNFFFDIKNNNILIIKILNIKNNINNKYFPKLLDFRHYISDSFINFKKIIFCEEEISITTKNFLNFDDNIKNIYNNDNILLFFNLLFLYFNEIFKDIEEIEFFNMYDYNSYILFDNLINFLNKKLLSLWIFKFKNIIYHECNLLQKIIIRLYNEKKCPWRGFCFLINIKDIMVELNENKELKINWKLDFLKAIEIINNYLLKKNEWVEEINICFILKKLNIFNYNNKYLLFDDYLLKTKHDETFEILNNDIKILNYSKFLTKKLYEYMEKKYTLFINDKLNNYKMNDHLYNVNNYTKKYEFFNIDNAIYNNGNNRNSNNNNNDNDNNNNNNNKSNNNNDNNNNNNNNNNDNNDNSILLKNKNIPSLIYSYNSTQNFLKEKIKNQRDISISSSISSSSSKSGYKSFFLMDKLKNLYNNNNNNYYYTNGDNKNYINNEENDINNNGDILYLRIRLPTGFHYLGNTKLSLLKDLNKISLELHFNNNNNDIEFLFYIKKTYGDEKIFNKKNSYLDLICHPSFLSKNNINNPFIYYKKPRTELIKDIYFFRFIKKFVKNEEDDVKNNFLLYGLQESIDKIKKLSFQSKESSCLSSSLISENFYLNEET